MKKRVLFTVLMIAIFMLVTISSVIGETDIKSLTQISEINRANFPDGAIDKALALYNL